MDEGDWRACQAISRAAVEGLPCVDHEDGSPAQEEEADDDQQHADYTLLGHQVGRRGAAGQTGHHWLAAGVGKVAYDVPPFGRLHVTAVTVTGLDAAGAGLSVCQERMCKVI